MIIDPDRHPQRYSEPSVAFADAARRLRDEVLTDPNVRIVRVMVAPPGAGKSTYAQGNLDGYVLDGCHADANDRRRLCAQIRKAGKLPVAVHVTTPLELCLQRNNRREPPKRVPSTVVRRMHKALEVHPPRKIEGWHEIHRVNAEGEREDG